VIVILQTLVHFYLEYLIELRLYIIIGDSLQLTEHLDILDIIIQGKCMHWSIISLFWRVF